MNRLALLRTRGLRVVAKAAIHGLRATVAGRLLSRRLIKRRIFDFHMLLDLADEGISRTLLLFGERELEHKWMLEQVLRPGMNVLDIGSNIGYYPLIELRVIGQQGKLIAIEPAPGNVELLEQNLALNGYQDVQVVQAAVSNARGQVELFLSRQRNLHTLHRNDDLHMSNIFVAVPAITVEDACRDVRPDFIRMDVEGHEVEILDGIGTQVQNGMMQPYILFEMHRARYSPEHSLELPLLRLFASGYGAAYVGSSTGAGSKTIRSYGYDSMLTIRTDDVVRSVFANVASSDLLDIVSNHGGVRSILLAPKTL